jgi:L-amino acid N-acyltransferase YncA
LENFEMVIRPAVLADAEAIARVHVESWRTTYAGIVPDEFLAALSVERRAEVWRNNLAENRQSYLVVAEQAGEVIGFAVGGPNREAEDKYGAELYAIYLLANTQKRGTGRALMKAVVQELARRGFTSLLVWVLVDNSACQFYQRLGGQFVREKEIEIGGLALKEAAYGWKSLAGFLE